MHKMSYGKKGCRKRGIQTRMKGLRCAVTICLHSRMVLGERLSAYVSLFVQYILGMSDDELRIYSAMRHVLHHKQIWKYCVTSALVSSISAGIAVATCYITYLQMWHLLVLVNILGKILISDPINCLGNRITSKMKIVVYRYVMATYASIRHSTEMISVTDYVTCVQRCLFPIIQLPSGVLQMSVRFATTSWTLCYVAYLLNPNWRHLFCTILYVAFLLRVDYPVRRYLRKEVKGFKEDSNKYFSVRHCLEKMMLNREIAHVPRTEWGSAHFRHSAVICNTLDTWNATMEVVSVFYLFLLYCLSIQTTLKSQESSFTNVQLTAILVVTSHVHFSRMYRFALHFAVPRESSVDMGQTFPRILRAILDRKKIHIVCRDLPDPLVLHFPAVLERSSELRVFLNHVKSKGHIRSSSSDVEIFQGERVLVCGDSGSGKSSMLQDVLGMTRYEDGIINSKSYQWIGEGVASSIDYKYLTMSRIFSLDCPTEVTERTMGAESVFGKNLNIGGEERYLVKLFSLDKLYQRSMRPSSNSKCGGMLNLENASAGEKSRLQAISCIWRAKKDPEIKLVVWDEGEQGISPSLYLKILQGLDTYLTGMTMICVSHCVKARTLSMWDKQIYIDG